jgi:ATP-dependent RNA helicase RhlE
MVVLDEADRMLDMGFLPDVKRILSQLPRNRQTFFFSATMPPTIVDLAKRMLTQPVNVRIQSNSVSVDKIEQKILFLQRDEKHESLRNIVTADGAGLVLVFTRTKRGADVVARKLDQSGIKTAAIHGNKSQNARQRALEAFRKHQIQVLVATDVAARGIDVDGITHVVNFDIPMDPESYVHRIGRTGRAGASGIAISFCTENERRELREIQKLLGSKVRLITDHSQAPSERRHRSSTPHAKGSTTPRSKPRRPSSRRSSTRSFAQASTANGKPKNKRKQRKGRNARQRVKQGSKQP